MIFLIPTLSLGQSQIQEKESQLRNAEGYEKLVLLNDLSKLYKSGSKKSLRYARQADLLANQLLASDIEFNNLETERIIEAKLDYGRFQYLDGSYIASQKTFIETNIASEEKRYSEGIEESQQYLERIDSLASIGEIKESIFDRIDIGSAISNSGNSMATATELKLAQVSEKKGDTANAISHYTKAASLMRARGEFAKAREIESKIQMYQYNQTMDSLRRVIARKPDSIVVPSNENIRADTTVVASSTIEIPQEAMEYMLSEQEELSDLREQAAQLEEQGDIRASLEAYKSYTELLKKWQEDSAAIAMAEIQMDRLQQQNKIADLNIRTIQAEKEAEVRLKNFLIIIAAFIGVSLLFILVLYLSKRKKHNQLEQAYHDLDASRLQLAEAEKNISKLLEQQVSPEIAEALIEDKPQRRKQFVAVMFVDIRGFTPIAEKMDPEELIEYQNKVFGFMIEIIRNRDGNINQFMGDGFMATFGAPVSHGNDVRNAYLAGKEILEQMKLLNESGTIPETILGIGIHAGDVVTGNVGTDSRKQYSVTGNTVIIAARVEQLNKKYDSQMIITEDVLKYLDNSDLDPGSTSIDVKVKGRTQPVKIIIHRDVITSSN